ncbi:hypothetical protein [Desulfovibrio inopinatus]|uniref:hypothetical protein n=1 Tax=Desulfovibrio inopinatus TaxID=102109 RepID=UPI000488DBAE|nr:hypothetical protein [Desulfovibrio inopinatus]
MEKAAYHDGCTTTPPQNDPSGKSAPETKHGMEGDDAREVGQQRYEAGSTSQQTIPPHASMGMYGGPYPGMTMSQAGPQFEYGGPNKGTGTNQESNHDSGGCSCGQHPEASSAAGNFSGMGSPSGAQMPHGGQPFPGYAFPSGPEGGYGPQPSFGPQQGETGYGPQPQAQPQPGMTFGPSMAMPFAAHPGMAPGWGPEAGTPPFAGHQPASGFGGMPGFPQGMPHGPGQQPQPEGHHCNGGPSMYMGAGSPGMEAQGHHQYSQMISMCNDLMQGKADPATIASFLTSGGTHFWKGAIVGALLTVVLKQTSVTSAVSESVSSLFKREKKDATS